MGIRLLSVYYELTDKFLVKADGEKVWSFFSDAGNLPRITPPWLKFRNSEPSPEVHEGAVLDYTISWFGVPVRWRTLIIDYAPPRQFIDLQVRGPYVLWHHQHTFEPAEGGTLCSDRVIYRLPAGVLGRMLHAAVVKRQLQQIFTYRRRIIGEELGLIREIHPIGIRVIK